MGELWATSGVPVGLKTLSIPLICQLNLVVWHLRASAEPRRNNRIEIERGWRGNIGENITPFAFGSVKDA